jgi:hypothetical protein
MKVLEFYASALDRGELTLHPTRFTPRVRRASGTNRIDWMGCRVNMNTVAIKNDCHRRESNPGHPVSGQALYRLYCSRLFSVLEYDETHLKKN